MDRDAFETKLLHVKGRRKVTVHEVPLDIRSMNCSDVFILDAGREIWQWNGKEASKIEKQKGLQVSREIRDQDRGGNAKVHIVEETDADDQGFWKAFGKPKPTRINPSTESDEAHERAAAEKIKFYKVSDETGKLVVSEIAERPLTQEMLDTKVCTLKPQRGVANVSETCTCMLACKEYQVLSTLETV